jgi:antitoxin CcdA
MAKRKEGRGRPARRRLAGYRGLHREGSRKGEVHKAFDVDGAKAARALARDLGLSDATFPNWAVTFRRQAGAASAPASPRVAVNVSLDAGLIAAAKALDINVSRAAEVGIAAEVARMRGERWLEENREALESYNDYVRKHGLPLEKHRLF